jgi:hypothetical protein
MNLALNIEELSKAFIGSVLVVVGTLILLYCARKYSSWENVSPNFLSLLRLGLSLFGVGLVFIYFSMF